MSKALLIRITAVGAGLAAFALLFLMPASYPPTESRFREWWQAYFPTAAEQVAQLIRLERTIESTAEPVARPVPASFDTFLVTEELRPRVDFWKRIYTDVNSYQALIHDSHNLERIYALVDLRDEPGADQYSFDSIRSAALRVLKRYRDHLRFLTSSRYDPKKLVGERKRLYNLMHARGGVKKYRGADQQVRVQRGLRDMLKTSIIRSGLYFPTYLEIFEELKLPPELTLLPHLESAFSYEAQSYAGAVGIWQLTKVAARPHLHINSAVDERIDPWRSAEVAALLLKDNYRQLRSWPLAITAYNQGAGSMKRAIRSLGTREIETIIERYRSRSFGFAGRNFYPAFLAIIEVLEHFEIHYGPLPIEPALTPRRHKLKYSDTLAKICQELGIEPQELEPFNPALRSHAYRNLARLPRGVYLNLPPLEESSQP
ncbi:MAG TPA: lytic transglycosylase domain-containing protein [Acidobacteriota bacterium]|nr:lytic transglycosylase domain-containing protein [Acidobacteriota bacterium]